MYNVKYKQYLNSELMVYYDSCIHDEECDKRKVVPTTGEICPPNRIVEYCPFTDDFEIMYNWHDDDSGMKRSMRRTKQIVYDIAQSNDWEYFMTFTFDKAKVDRYSYDDTCSKLSNWLKNMRKISKNLRYIVVPEQHKDGAWHFHGLFMNVDGLDFVDSGKRYNERIVYNVGKYRFGWTTAIPTDGKPNVCTYLTKYITKDVCECSKGKKRYWASRNCDKPIEYKFLVEGGLKEFEELYNASEFQITSENAYQRAVYNHQPIYTTNTTRFNTSEIEFYPPRIEIIE